MLRGREPSPALSLEPSPPLIDGFGSYPLTHSLLPAGGARGAAPLEGVQLITRFCEAEQPYWAAFVQHYRGLGVVRIHACVQTEADRLWLLESAGAAQVSWLQVHRLCGDVTPDQALRGLDLGPLRDQAPLTLLVDCDEFLGFQRGPFSLRQLLELYPECGQWHLPWLMRPLLRPEDSTRGGYWGHVGKPIVRSQWMEAIAHDHLFVLRPSIQTDAAAATVPLGVHGVVLVHLWGRSFRDGLIKVFFNRFKDAKSADRDRAQILLAQGELPIRLRLLAYLDLQEGYLPLGLVHGPPSFALEAEERMLRQWLSVEQEERALVLWTRYRSQLTEQLVDLPRYPAIALVQLASMLPPLQR